MQLAIKHNRPDMWTDPDGYMAWLLDHVARPDDGPKLPWIEDSYVIGPCAAPQKRWHVIVTEPSKERTVADDLKRGNIDPFLPERRTFRKRSHRSSDKRIPMSRPLMPGYVFAAVETTRNAEWVLGSCRHAIDFLRKGLSAAIIPASEVRHLQDRESAGDFDQTVVRKKGWGREAAVGPYAWILPGQRVHILDGPFASFDGVVEAVDFGRHVAKIRVEVFGRPTPVQHEFAQFELLC